LIKQRKEIL